jgi:N-acyl-D-amino-acid deacylase
MRSEGARLLEAIDEVLDLTRATGIRAQISHLKTSGRANWGKLDAALARITDARAAGCAVHADRYPYLASGTDLDVVLPDWAAAGGADAALARLDDAATRARIVAELDAARPGDEWENVMVGGTVAPELRALRGQTIAAIARARGVSGGAAAVAIMRRDRLRSGAFFSGMCADNMRRIYAQAWVMVGSDASVRAPTGPLGADHPHPRAYGAFPRFLRMALDEKWFSPAEAIRRVTGLPAAAFGLKDRGRVAVGAFADLTLLDWSALRDCATYAAPHAFSEGVRRVWVNGACSYADGRCTGARRGQVLDAKI